MKLTARYLRPFWALVLLCVVLLFGQAMTELSLPNLMSDLVNVGIQQGGLEEGAPPAMSQKALTLLCHFADGEAKAALTDSYYIIEPESSEAQRLSKDYPLARKEAVCLLREGLDPEALAALDTAYAQASYGFLLFMQEMGQDPTLLQEAQTKIKKESPSAPARPSPTPGEDMDGDADSVEPGPSADPNQGGETTPITPDNGGGIISSDPNIGLIPDAGDYISSDPNIGLIPDGPVVASSSDLIVLPKGEKKPAYTGPVAGDMAAGSAPALLAMADTSGDQPDETFGGFAPAGDEYPATDGVQPHADGVQPSTDSDASQPDGEGGNARQDDEPVYFGEDGQSEAPDGAAEGESSREDQEPVFFEEGAGGFDLSASGGLAKVSAAQLYTLLPLLDAMPGTAFSHAIETAKAGSAMMGGQVGVSLKKLFLEEVGLDTAPIQSGYIWATGLKMLGVAFLGALAAVLVGLISSRIAAAVGRRLRHDLFEKVMALGGPELDKVSPASLITRTTNDVQQVQMLVMMGLRLVCYAPIMGVGGIIFALDKSVSMSWIVAVAVVAMLGLVLVAMAVVMPRFKALQGLIDRLNRISREHLSGLMVVRAFGNEAFEEQRFEVANRELADTNRFVQRAMSALMPLMMLVMNLSSLVIIWVGGHAIAESTLQIGDMMAFIQYAMQIIASFLMIAMMFVMVPRASVSAGRIGEVLDMPLAVKDPESPEALETVKGEIEFKDVTFRYDEAESPVLEHISFTARPGETTALIGATGAGKSTLINLIPRFYDVTEGAITLDGVDIRKIPQKQLREQIGLVPQKALLFSGSIRENLCYGKEDAGEEELHTALMTAQAADFVEGLEKGLDAHMAQGGGNVSGGQRQRLSIARALMRKAPVIILDDSFSALDFKTDAALRKALREELSESTVLIVAQRVSTIMHAQQILVLDEGRLVGKGTHKELLESCPAYREIAQSQLQKEELA